MKIFLITVALLITLGCASQKGTVNSNKSNEGVGSNAGSGDTRTKDVEFIDDNTYLLTEFSTDKTYGFEKSNPIMVGEKSPLNERRFLNGLLGPNGEKVKYFRAGSCCPFKTPNGFIDNQGLLDLYRVYWTGSKDTLDIYINMYDKGDLQVPVGFTAKKKF